MNKTKTKVKAASAAVLSREEMGEVCGEIATLQNRINVLKAAMNVELQAVRARYAVDLDPLEAAVKQLMAGALSWCEQHEQTEFEETKTLDFVQAKAQFRAGTPEVTLRRNWNEEMAVAALKASKVFAPYVRTVEVINRQRVLEDRTEHTPEEWFERGIKITRGRSLIVTPKGAALENNAKAAAA